MSGKEGSIQMMSKRRGMYGAGLLAAALLLAGGALGAEERRSAANEVVVGPDDTVTISALDFEEINKAWRVSSSGDLNLPLLGRVQAAGMTVRELESELTRRAKKYFHQPQIVAYVSESRSQPVTVTGPVNKPGTVQLQGSHTLFDVIAAAGGTKDAGDTITVTRAVDSGPIDYPTVKKDETGRFYVVELPLREVVAGGTRESALAMRANDMVSVSEVKKPKTVYVTGEVIKPGAIELVTQDSVSLVRAIAMAGGLSRTAKNKAVLMHVREDGTRTAIAELELGRILKGKVADIELVAGDILVVPSSQMSTLLGTVANSAVMTGIWTLGRL
ncbi:MAG: SLBB domain-containing protein [Bryobacteraceae bacterium]